MIPHPGLGVLASSGSVVEYYCRVQSSSTVVESVIVVDPHPKFLHQFQKCRRVRLLNIVVELQVPKFRSIFQKPVSLAAESVEFPCPFLLSLLFPVPSFFPSSSLSSSFQVAFLSIFRINPKTVESGCRFPNHDFLPFIPTGEDVS